MWKLPRWNPTTRNPKVGAPYELSRVTVIVAPNDGFCCDVSDGIPFVPRNPEP